MVLSNRVQLWAPRALSVLFIAFVSLFALDVFQERVGFWQTLVHLAMHLIPSLLMLAALALAWRWEWVGGAAFAAAGVFFLDIARGPWAKVVFAAPCFLTAVLFLMNWRLRIAHRPAPRL